MRPSRAAGASCLLAFFVFVVATRADESIVSTPMGTIQGVVYQNYRAFYGVPFAAPPVGPNRWAPTVSAKPWSPAVWNATYFRPGCPQTCHLPPHTCPETTSEDCLYLNIFTPRVANLSSKIPVGIFLPGGNFRQGGIGTPLYDGGPLVQTGNIILVTSAYRLGALGFLAVGATQGNYGILDQQEMLRWIQQNIGAYGGDPTQVTIFGQSAGATSVAVHLTIPSSIGLFHKAIMQSDPIELPLKTSQDQKLIGNKFCQALGCSPSDLNCLRSKTAEQIVAAQDAAQNVINVGKPIQLFYPWVPTIEGKMITMQPLDAFQKGQYQKNIPLMLGSVSEEAFIFIFMADSKPLSDVEYGAALLGVFGLNQAAKVGYMYPPPLFGDKRPTIATVATDLIFSCTVRNASSVLSASGSAPVFAYLFNHSMAYDAWGPQFSFCVGHVCHGADLPFSFGVQVPGVFQMTPQEVQMSGQMMEYWTNFMHSGNPNKGPNNPALVWPVWSPSRPTMVFETPSYVGPYWRQSFCDFWDKSGYHWGF